MTDGYYKCDRCGKYERGPQRSGGRTNYADEKYRKISYGHREGDGEARLARTVDLCESCRWALTKFLDGDGDE